MRQACAAACRSALADGRRPVAAMNAQAFSLIATGDAEGLSDDLSALLSRPGRSFEQFARDHIAAFSAA